MLTADDIQQRVKDRPFVPIRIVTSSGESYDVHHPDLIMVGRGFLIIGTPSAENPTQSDRVARVSVLHVTAIQDLPVPAPPPGNNGTA